MSFFSDLFNNNRSVPSAINPNSTLGNYFQGSTRTLPNGGGQYTIPTSTTPQQRSTLSAPTGTPNWGSPRVVAQPPTLMANTGQGGSTDSLGRSTERGVTLPPYNPTPTNKQGGMGSSSGTRTSSQDMALIANSIRAEQQRETGDIGSYAEGAYADMNRLKNVRDDIATGVNDPYEWAGGSGIPYSPQELSAIESAMAGIYDPAIESAKAKYERAARMDEMKYESDLRKEEDTHSAGLKASASGGGLGGGSGSGDPTIDAWVSQIQSGGATLSQVPSAIRNRVVTAMNSAPKSSNLTETGFNTLNMVNSLLSNNKTSRISGFFDRVTGGHMGESATVLNEYNTLKGNLALGIRGLLKGSGAISDYESKVLAQASTALGRNMKDSAFKNQLIQIKGALLTQGGQSAMVRITDLSTGESGDVMADSMGIQEALLDGYKVEYI